MDTGLSKDADGSSHGSEGEENLDHAGDQLYVSLKMENYRLKAELIPHVYGSVPLVGSWDSSKALSMEPESASMWELSFVVPPNHETLDFKFLLKPKYSNSPCVVEEGPNRLLTGGALQEESRLAVFKNGDVTVEYRVFIKSDRVSPFDLAASWRVYQENLRPSTVRGIPDVSINSAPIARIENGSSAGLEIDLEHYVIPAPSTSANSAFVYAADNTENPRFSNVDCSDNASYSFKDSGVSADRPKTIKEMEVVIPDPSKVYSGSDMVESKSVETFSSLQKQDGHRGLFVDRGVGSPRSVKSPDSSAFSFDLKQDTETKEMEVVIPDPSKVYSGSDMVESKSVETFSSLQKQDGHRGLFVDRGVGSPRSVKSPDSSAFSFDLKQDTETKEMEVVIPDPSKVYSGSDMVESKSVETFSSLQKQDGHRGLFVDRGVGSPRSVKSPDSSAFSFDLKQDTETKNSMPAAAAAVADQMLGPKEDRHLAIVLVGLPARGKTFTAAKLTRYLRWLGHDTKHFNVGKYRRLKHGTNQSADFFRADNPEGMEARNEVAALAMDDMIAWMQEGGQVGIFDATNSTRKRRNMLMKMAEGKCKIIFLETLCNDERIIERNIRLKIQQSPDYAEQPDFEAGLQDFKSRLANYEKVYEPVEEGSYIKMIDMVSGHGGQIQVNNISGYLPGRIVFFLVNTHLTPRPILLTRHGESRDNVGGRIGGDTVLSDAGEIYAKKLANFVEKRLKSEKAASIWTSTLQRTTITANPIIGFPKIQWRALDEINAGVCDGMTYEEIKKNMPEEYEARKKDKLRYRYPRGESYLDVIQRLEPVIIELERQRAPVVVISHQAVLRALYAYFSDRPLNEIPHIEVPLHTIIEIKMGVTGVQEKRYKLMD